MLKLTTAYGPVYREIKNTKPRDARPGEIPVIDISGMWSKHLADRQHVADQIYDAATTIGFFYIKGHGIPDEVIQHALAAAKAFFYQPEEIKQRVNQKNCKFRNGWYPPRSNRVNETESIDHRESFAIRYDPLYDPEVEDVDAIPEEIRRGFRMDDYCWIQTANLPMFKDHILAYWRSCLSLARRLIKIFALALRLPEDYFDKMTSHPDAAVALNYYPQLPSYTSEDELENVSIGSHTDLQCFTMLWQDQNGGLQLLNRDGEWINAVPIEGTLVVNIGDYMMRITNDRFISTVHRAKNFKPCERYSMPFFFGMYCRLSERKCRYQT